MYKAFNGNTRKWGETWSKLTIKAAERRHGVFNVNFEHISHLLSSFSNVDFQPVDAIWELANVKMITKTSLRHLSDVVLTLMNP